MIGKVLRTENSIYGDLVASDDEMVPVPLCSIPPGIEWDNKFSNWVLRWKKLRSV